MSSPAQMLVQSKAVKSATLHRRLPTFQHAYVWPFTLVYPAWLYVYTLRYDDFLGSQEFTVLSLMIVIMSQALVFLMCQWSVNLYALFTCQSVSDPYEAELVKVLAANHFGKNAVCEMLSFVFQALKYIYDDNKKVFSPVTYLSDSCPPLGELQSASGLSSSLEIKEALEVYGENKFKIPVPTFIDLFKEHAVAPFFVFQVFCVGLWCMDEYWYYSIFSLLMLVVFESTLVFQRLRTLNEFSSLSMHPYKIQALRSGQWTEVGTEALCPGDIISITRTMEDSGVPCDVVLLEGSCIVNEAMLSGESTPQLKESIHMRDSTDILDMEGEDKNSMLFGGTKVLQVDPPTATSRIATPDGGCACYVLRTGFGTSQGELVRTMIHSTERVSADNKESYLFIGFLLIFAILASAYVWIECSKNPNRPKSKVLLHCVLIITSVVPPELPMELSMAVNSSLMALTKLAIFCTEPFRIPHAGKIDICCFDKTGTLTGEDLVVEGVAGAPGSVDSSSLLNARAVGRDAALTLASAHALVQLDDGELVGDPMERAQLEAAGFKLVTSDIIVPESSAADELDKAGIKVDKLKITVNRRFPFSSALKRSGTLSEIKGLGAGTGKAVKHSYFVAIKGAPEVIRGMLRSVPSWYDEAYKSFSRRGGRWVPRNTTFNEEELSDISREEIESDLAFQGFLDSSSHRCIMITGDSPLTAAHVAREVVIVDQSSNSRGPVVTCTSVDETVRFSIDTDDAPRMQRAMDGWDLCMTGAALDILKETSLWRDYLMHHVWIYARFVLTEYKLANYITLMCGDGTNDVGVALLNGSRQMIQRLKQAYDAQCRIARRFNQPPPNPSPILKRHMEKLAAKEKEREKELAEERRRIIAAGGLEDKKRVEAAKKAEQLALETESQRQNANPQAEWMMQMDTMEDDVPVLKFGDASLGSINAICNIIRQGRSTLILGLTCLISAYSLSSGDWQATIMGALMSASPLEKLSKERPQPHILTLYMLLTVLGQFAVHVAAMVFVTREFEFDTMYLIQLSQQISTFAINYQGHPFREALKDNRFMYRGLIGVGVIAVFLKLVPMPESFRDVLCVAMAVDFALAYVVEKPIAQRDVVERTRAEELSETEKQN
ncbi:hypothetical protein BX070DRAFT_223094 [Coemansia spiralis]|nr:hypothetical protein BX070DRAFT_223094 [Coemansia spiralis]